MTSKNQFQRTYNAVIDKQVPIQNKDFRRTVLGKDLKSIQPFTLFPCMLCYEDKDLYKFAECQHKLACNQCIQKWVKISLVKKQIPTCYLQTCSAKMTTRQGSSFSFFTQETKQKYKNMLKIKQILDIKIPEIGGRKQNVIRQCRVVNCQGYINHKTYACILCETVHCQKCFKNHAGKSCAQAFKISVRVDDVSLNLKKCPLCLTGFQIQTGGCNKFKCNYCRHQFCIHCNKEWSAFHHLCGNSLPIYMVPYLWLKQSCCISNVSHEEKTTQLRR